MTGHIIGSLGENKNEFLFYSSLPIIKLWSARFARVPLSIKRLLKRLLKSDFRSLQKFK